MNPKVDAYIGKLEKWREETEKLRAILLECPVTEELKWGVPCYTVDDKNVVLIHGFKEYCAILFVKGALLKDPKGILIQQTENVQSARQVRFTSLQEIVKLQAVLKTYIRAAIEVEKAGLKVVHKSTEEFEVAEEFQNRLDKTPTLKKAFEALTPGRQRAYLLHFSSAKQSKTRESRIEKCLPMILDGKGLNNA
ncbi:YdeI family protein [Paraburkholderia caribensis]|uniref:YdeI family protein n=1 Tax=Paraburkholderia caribensis TaxID=75105 RepID=UPI0034D23138